MTSTTLEYEPDSLLAPAPDEYVPTEQDWDDYEAYWQTVNLVAKLKAVKPHVPKSDWVTLMWELGRLSSDELCAATEIKRLT
jgi:hypothetical protein